MADDAPPAAPPTAPPPDASDGNDDAQTKSSSTAPSHITPVEGLFPPNPLLDNPNEPLKFQSDPSTGRGSKESNDVDAKTWEGTVRPASNKAREWERHGLQLRHTYSSGHEDSRQERFRVRHKETGGFLRDFSTPVSQLPPSMLKSLVEKRVAARIKADPGTFAKDVQAILDDLEAKAKPPPKPPMHHLPAHPYGHPALLHGDFVYEDGGVVKQDDQKESDAFDTDWKHEWVHKHWSKDHTGLQRHAAAHGQTEAEARDEAKAIFSAADADKSGSVSASELLAFLQQGKGADGKPLGVNKADIYKFMEAHDTDNNKQLDEAEFVEFFGSHGGGKDLPAPWCYLQEAAVQPEPEGLDIFVAPKTVSSFERTTTGRASTMGSRITGRRDQQRDAQNRRVMADLLAKRHRLQLRQKRESGRPIDERAASKSSSSSYARRLRDKKEAFLNSTAQVPELKNAATAAAHARAAARRSAGGVTRRAWAS